MKRFLTMAAGLTILMAGCGSGSGGGANGPAGVDRSKQVTALDDADKGALCDWFAPMVGGYGAPAPCSLGGVSAPPDKATCIAEFPVCDAAIGVFEDCIVAVVAAGRTCTDAALGAAAA